MKPANHCPLCGQLTRRVVCPKCERYWRSTLWFGAIVVTMLALLGIAVWDYLR